MQVAGFFNVATHLRSRDRPIKMPLGMEVGLSPADFVLDGDPAPSQKGGGAPGAEPPIFGPCLFWPNGWMHQDATWYGGRPLC